ncbi:MAG: DEAD/DEAH box helicase [Gemmatimonadales bacterium]|nr:DEAD/DEAH box helicase [Gemmatimonadales bacterium]
MVIAPTRAACETIELALGTEIETLLQRKHGDTLIGWAGSGIPFGIVAGTGTGKTLSIRLIAQAILQESLRYGVVNREREATPETPTWNVVIVTTGIARRWFQDDLIAARDTLIVDEIHQTSAELELCLALGKRAGCRFIWLSATVDPTFYAKYLSSQEVLETSAFDPRLRAKVTVVGKDVEEFLEERYLRRIIKEKRGVAVFVPTRAEVERLARDLGDQWPRLASAFYHGGQPIRVIRPFLEGGVEKPFLLAMTAAGQSALNIPGLDTVIIYDARYANEVERGRNVLHRKYLGANEILQMAGRVHGRVPGGEVTILSDRPVDFDALRPTPPEFQLAGDAERVALTCAAIGVDARDLDLPVALDRTAYRRALELLTSRGIVANGRLTDYGREVEAMPVERPWAELLVHAPPELAPIVAVSSNIDSLHRMTREERELHGVLVQGSDHLTAYNLYAEAVNQHGGLGEVYGLPRHVFEQELDEWAERRGVLVKAIEDAALGTASVYRSLEAPLPRTLPYANRELRQQFAELVAEVMPFDLVIDEHTADGLEVRVSKTSVAGSWGAIAGTIRFFADRFGTARASVEGTTISHDLVRRYASLGPPSIALTGPRKHQQLAVARRLTYFGFELETDIDPLRGAIPAELAAAAREALVSALVAGETTHPDQGRIRRGVTQLREWWRRSGGRLAAASDDAVRAQLQDQLEGVTSWEAFLETPLLFDPAAVVPEAERRRLDALPGMVRLRGDAVGLEYEVDGGEAVVRLLLREGQVRRLTREELPALDRPLRFAVVQGGAPVLRAETLNELKELVRVGAARAHRHRQHPRAPRRGGRRR